MRILAVTNLFPNPFEPHRAAFNRQQFLGLARHHDLRVIAPIAWTEELAARWRGQPRLPWGRRVDFSDIPVDHPRYLYPPGIFRGWYGHLFRWSIRRAFARAVAEFRPNLVYAPWAYPDGWAAIDLAHRAGLPVVLKVLGSDILLLDSHPGRRRGTIEALQRADRIVAVSRHLADQVIAFGTDAHRVHVVYDGVDASLFHPGPRDAARRRLGLDPDQPIILFVGNLVPVKGLDVLIEACRLLASRGSRFTCHLIGQGPLRSELERQIRAKGLEEMVRLHGSRPHTQLPDWFRAANVFALPSRSEGVPNVLLEAAACGTPFVASRVGGIPEIAHLGVNRLVSPDNAEQLGDAVDEFLKLSASPVTRNTAQPRDAAEPVRELVTLFEEVLADRCRARPCQARELACSGVPGREGT